MKQSVSVLALPGNRGLRNAVSQSPLAYFSPRRAKKASLQHVVRWGWWGKLPAISGHEFNVREALRVNKRQQKELWKEKNIPHVEVVDSIEGQCVMRPTRHRQGRHFYLVESMSEVQKIQRENRAVKTWYMMPFYHKVAEYRVHCWFGKVLLVQQKINTEGRNVPNWNHDQGFIFEVLPWSGIPRGLNHVALEACDALGLDFTAIDIIHCDGGANHFRCLEANTAPGLNGEYTIQRYAAAFSWLQQKIYTAESTRPDDRTDDTSPTPRHPFTQPRERKTMWRFDVQTEES